MRQSATEVGVGRRVDGRFQTRPLPPDPASRCLQLRRNLADHLPINTQVRRRTELSDALGIACIQGGASKRSRMEEQVFGKMSAESLTDISNDGTGGELRGSGQRPERGNKKRVMEQFT